MPLQCVDVNDINAYKPLEEVFIGEKPRNILVILIYLSDSDLSSSKVRNVRSTYMSEILDYKCSVCDEESACKS